MRWQTVIISVFIFKRKSSIIQDDIRWMFAMYTSTYILYVLRSKNQQNHHHKKCTKEMSSYSQSHIWYMRRKCITRASLNFYNEIIQFDRNPDVFAPNHNGEQSVFNVLKHFFRGKCSLSQQQIPSRIFSIIAQIAVYLLCSLFSSIYCIVKSKCQSYSEHSLWLFRSIVFYHDFASHGIVKKK